jgi:hypothetical protein
MNQITDEVSGIHDEVILNLQMLCTREGRAVEVCKLQAHEMLQGTE